MRRQAQDPRARETSNGSFMKWASLAVDLKAFGHVGEVGETCVPDVRRRIQAFPQGELQRERPYSWIRLGIGTCGSANEGGGVLARQV